ncbi:MAG: CDP-archaeol synthase [Clostridia bacterium]|nr:CDP-archaeol synthase [Clostridia bacterium]
MLKRIITGAGYVVVMLAVFLLREFVDYRAFHLFTLFITVVGTFEAARAVTPWAIKGTFSTAIIFSGLLVPIYLAVEYMILGGYGFISAILLIVLAILVIGAICLIKKSGIKTFLVSALPFIYPAIFTVFMLCANEMGKDQGFIVLLLSFVISPFSDTLAYFVGSLIGGKKLCPKLSPKKTWSGAIGGTVGGAIGAVLVYFIFKSRISVNFFSPLLLFVLIGVVGSIVGIFGDLFESFIKRRAGIKDMGNLLPGHGGVLDRVDSTLFLVTFLYLIFLIV